MTEASVPPKLSHVMVLLAALLSAPAFAEDIFTPITSLPGITLEPGYRVELAGYHAPYWSIGYVPEYEALTITAEAWPTIIVTEYWATFYGKLGTISSGELILLNLPEMPPQEEGRPLCRTPDGRVYVSTQPHC